MAVKRTHKGKEAEARILVAILSYWDERGYPPTYREIGSRIGVAHSAVHGYIRDLSEAGLVHGTPSTARSLRLSPAGRRIAVAARHQLEDSVDRASA
jgi:Mn-dependent DtxR family transcriptional regulator